MTQSAKATQILSSLDPADPKMGDVKKIAAGIKKDHELALELWATAGFGPRLVAVLIMDKMQLTQGAIDGLAADMSQHSDAERDKLSEWLLAHQLSKSKKTKDMILGWETHPSPTLRRLFWYHQARLRWTGQTPPDNTADLMSALQKNLANETPEVQWAMNFCAGQIGVHDPQFRTDCIRLGEKTGLYKGDPVSRGCTPSYLPEFIEIEVAKRA